MIKVFIADDHAIVRHGLRQLIESSGDMELAGEAIDGRELLVAAETGGWDVLILDLSLPRVSGLEALRRIRERWPRLAIVVLSMYAEEQYAVPVMRAGAAAYLSKDRPGNELMAAIRKAASGGTYVTATVAEQVLRAPDKLPHETLTAREYQIFTLVVHGSTVSEIAAELNLTAGTVSGHLQRVKTKLGAHSIAEIVSYAHRMGFVD
ncbi:DNA-binding response regulator, LuxR family protein [Minicystis rosea]|nr:DNA-binding response regulator, LuxR family protein [Minicystis rosea]